MDSSLIVEVSEGVNQQYLETIAQLFTQSFGAVRGETAFGEGHDSTLFMQLVAHPSMRCFTAYRNANEPVGFAAVTRNLQRIGWVEEAFYRDRYPAAFAEQRFYYLPYVFVHPSARALGLVGHLFERVIDALAPERALVGFDVSIVNMGLVDIFRAVLAEKTGAGHAVLVDTHSFFVAPLDGTPAELLSLNRTPPTIEPR